MEDDRPVITVVCTGNVCRSPMAERLLKHALKGEPSLSHVKVYSAGISAYTGDGPSENAIKALEKVGLDLSDHRSRRLSPELLEISDIIFTMTRVHRDLIRELYPQVSVPILLFREPAAGDNAEVPDPFGGNLDLYLETRDSLAEAIPPLVGYIKENLS